MAYNNSDEIFISMHRDDPEAFYAKIPYDKLPNIHRIGGKWMQSGKEWRFPLDDEIWAKFQKEFAPEFSAGKVHKDIAFLLAFDKRHRDLQNFLSFKEVAMKDEPTDFESMTKAQLIAYAEEHNIEVSSSWTKAQIIEAIEAAQ